MKKINFKNKEQPAINDTNLNLMQDNIENELNAIENELNAKVNTSDLIDLIYPTGSVYMSVNNVSPAILFGGTWEQIKDKFLLSAGDTYNAGDEGGNATHKHLSPMTWYENGGSNIGTTNLYGFDRVHDRDFYGIANQKIEYNREIEKLAYRTSTESNMPPYLAVFMWKRTS